MKEKQQPKSKFNKQKSIIVKFEGKLKAEIVRRASASGYNNEIYTWLRTYLKKLWKVEE